jgi:hypothetical protein
VEASIDVTVESFKNKAVRLPLSQSNPILEPVHGLRPLPDKSHTIESMSISSTIND